MQRHPVLVFFAMRTALLVVVALVLSLMGVNGVLALLIALVVSSILSLKLLSKQRDAVSEAIAARLDRTRGRLDSAAASEDE
ncbi:DUF4229 domain-containing protein [Motilibacter aurantiacus]|uniref:DUF4229 domain-containing protein n=1 Tax=Motilibacter aurantiacus TaxID=2714955 RepID=UPI00140CF02C|nr:DUF4229 domain-containing protein [Motilibacter aurantiacus]